MKVNEAHNTTILIRTIDSTRRHQAIGAIGAIGSIEASHQFPPFDYFYQLQSTCSLSNSFQLSTHL